MSDPEVSSRPTDSRSPSVPVLRLRRQLFYYLVVGGLTVVVDIGLQALEDEPGVPFHRRDPLGPPELRLGAADAHQAAFP